MPFQKGNKLAKGLNRVRYHRYIRGARAGYFRRLGKWSPARTGSPTPTITSGDRHFSDAFVKFRELVLSQTLSHAARSTTPAGTSPVVARYAGLTGAQMRAA